MPNTLNFIPDGYTESAFVRAIPNIHGDFRFEYRPMLVEERTPLLAASNSMKPDAYDRKCAAELAKKLVSWDLADEKGNAVPISAANILRLKPKLWGRVFAIVAGLDAHDGDPGLSVEKKGPDDDDQYESALSGKPVGDVRQEGDAKN